MRAYDLNKITESLRNKLKMKAIKLRNLENLRKLKDIYKIMTHEEQYKTIKKYLKDPRWHSISIRANTKPSKEIGSISENTKEVMEECYTK